MDSIVNFLGGYDSWQFATITWGLLIVGLILRIKWVWMIPIPFIGLGLMYLTLNHAYEIASVNMPDSATDGLASILPILSTAIGAFVILNPSVVARMFGISHKQKDDKNDTNESR